MRRVILGLALLLLLALPARGQPAAAIAGDYIEDRSNHVHGCYCEWSGESQTAGREAVLAWRIRSGAYGGADLAGLRIAAVVRGESALAFGSPRRESVLLISDASSAEQRRAGERLIRDRLGRFLGAVLAVRSVPMEFDIGSGGASVRVPGILLLEMRKAVLPDDALPGAIRWFGPFTPMTEITLGTTEAIRYSGREFNATWSRTEPATTGYYGRFIFYLRENVT